MRPLTAFEAVPFGRSGTPPSSSLATRPPGTGRAWDDMGMDSTELREIPLFEGLSPQDLERVAGWFELIDVPAGWYLLNQGSYPEGFFVVLEGSVTVEREGIDVATVDAGDFFGEIALLEDDRRTATVTSATRVRAAVMDAAAFFEMCAEVPQIGQRVTSAAIERGQR